MPLEKFKILGDVGKTLVLWKRKLEYLFAYLDNPTLNYLTFKTSGVTPSTNLGTMYYDVDDQTITSILPNGVRLQHGQELYKMCVNKTGVTITNGSVVYISGVQGQRPTITLADADEFDNVHKIIGMVTQDIEDNAEGKVTTFGEVRDVDTSSFTAGDLVYVSQTAGQVTNVEPADTISRIIVGTVLNSHANQGSILIGIRDDHYMFGDPQNGNYSYFNSVGKQKLIGDATLFDDEKGSALQLEVSGVGASINTLENTLDFVNTANLSDYAFDNYQFTHARKLGTNVYPHIHWKQVENNTPNLLIKYRWQINGQPFTTTWSNYPCTGLAFTYGATPINQISYGAGVSPPSTDGISATMQIRVYRDRNNDSSAFASTGLYTQTVNITFVDIHREMDDMGSASQFIKDT